MLNTLLLYFTVAPVNTEYSRRAILVKILTLSILPARGEAVIIADSTGSALTPFKKLTTLTLYWPASETVNVLPFSAWNATSSSETSLNSEASPTFFCHEN
jgi:hypothetical protein